MQGEGCIQPLTLSWARQIGYTREGLLAAKMFNHYLVSIMSVVTCIYHPNIQTTVEGGKDGEAIHVGGLGKATNCFIRTQDMTHAKDIYLRSTCKVVSRLKLSIRNP